MDPTSCIIVLHDSSTQDKANICSGLHDDVGSVRLMHVETWAYLSGLNLHRSFAEKPHARKTAGKNLLTGLLIAKKRTLLAANERRYFCSSGSAQIGNRRGVFDAVGCRQLLAQVCTRDEGIRLRCHDYPPPYWLLEGSFRCRNCSTLNPG
jgi:hypothetical protein